MRKLGNTLLIVALLTLASCGNDFTDDNDITGVTSTSSSSSDDSSIDIDDIEFDETPLDEGTETIPSGDTDYVENASFYYTVNIVYDGTSATATGDVSAVDISISGAHVTVTSQTSGVEYILSGSSDDGSFKIYSTYKMKIELNGLTLTNPTGAVINDQCSKTTYFVLPEDEVNTLTDGTSYTTTDDEDMKGTIFSEGQIVFSGNGVLNVYANCKNGIVSDDYIIFRPGNVINVKNTASNGVKANDAVSVRGGVLNIGVTAAGSKGINSEGTVDISGGRTTIITTGGGVVEDNDAKGCAGIKSDGTFTMTAGEVAIQSSGAGGKGISGDTSIDISGGTITIITTGKQYTSGRYDTSPKGIKADGALTISDGDITVSTTGGDGAEGIESKTTMTISGGDVVVYSYDDALNASTKITISGGRVYANATNNDGIDSNGTLYITGGVVIGLGTTTPEGPFDCDNSTFAITGGTVIGFGGESSIPTTSSTKQPVILYGGKSYSKGNYLALTDSSGDAIFSFLIPRSYSSSVLVLSSPEMSVGSTYIIKSGVSVSDGTSWQGYSDDATVSGGSTLQSVSVSSYVTTSGTSNSTSGLGIGIGGGGPGRRW